MASPLKRPHASLDASHHLDWSHKQGRILTANGKANEFYVPSRGFAFAADELPHHLLLSGTSHEVFERWRHQRKQQQQREESNDNDYRSLIVCGAWFRRYFVGGWEISTDQDEITYNLQSANLFCDLRIPKSRRDVLPPEATSLADYTNEEVRYFARQHVFAGYSRLTTSTYTSCSKSDTSDTPNERGHCTRHHVLDWNFVGSPRPRPNKWYIEPMHSQDNVPDVWKEWAYATDDHGQHYYCEQWERREGDGRSKLRLALRQKRESNNSDEDGILIIVGDHFQYCMGTMLLGKQNKAYPEAASLVDLVDAAIAAGDRETAEAYCSRIDAGHGLLSSGWTIDTAIRPWLQGCKFLEPDGAVVSGDSIENCSVVLKGKEWDIFDCTVETVEELQKILLSSAPTKLS